MKSLKVLFIGFVFLWGTIASSLYADSSFDYTPLHVDTQLIDAQEQSETSEEPSYISIDYRYYSQIKAISPFSIDLLFKKPYKKIKKKPPRIYIKTPIQI